MEWSLNSRDLKRYPHFDSDISAKQAIRYVTEPANVASHSFYPFMMYDLRWNKWSKKGEKGKPKNRPIRYAARRDAYIFAYYRHLLSERYEAELSKRDLGNAVLAYRRITDPKTGRGKCNIHFARDAFEKITELGDCAVIALDISSYFESIDHERLKAIWCELLGVERLPKDHFKVFQAITNYSFVHKREVYERLGHFGQKIDEKSGRTISGYLTPFREIPRPQLCSPETFRDDIAGKKQPSIIQKRTESYGIPQGAPISDLLANAYLLEFDTVLAEKMQKVGGFYCRYSDDILLVVPGEQKQGLERMKEAQTLISHYGQHLQIKEEKSFIYKYSRQSDGSQAFVRHLGADGQARNGLEYLGFRFDGKRIYLRDSTLSGLWRKVTKSARAEALATIKRYPGKSADELKELVNVERFTKRFGRVEDFAKKPDSVRNWTFWTYARRAIEIMGPRAKPINSQLKRHRQTIRTKLNDAIERAYVKWNCS